MMGKMRPVWEQMDARVFIPLKSPNYSFKNIMYKVLFPICNLIWRVNNYVSRQGTV